MGYTNVGKQMSVSVETCVGDILMTASAPGRGSKKVYTFEWTDSSEKMNQFQWSDDVIAIGRLKVQNNELEMQNIEMKNTIAELMARKTELGIMKFENRILRSVNKSLGAIVYEKYDKNLITILLDEDILLKLLRLETMTFTKVEVLLTMSRELLTVASKPKIGRAIMTLAYKVIRGGKRKSDQGKRSNRGKSTK
jgi:hypothetical protein